MQLKVQLFWTTKYQHWLKFIWNFLLLDIFFSFYLICIYIKKSSNKCCLYFYFPKCTSGDELWVTCRTKVHYKNFNYKKSDHNNNLMSCKMFINGFDITKRYNSPVRKLKKYGHFWYWIELEESSAIKNEPPYTD